MRNRLIAVFLSLFFSLTAFCQTNSVYRDYIDQYKAMAVEQMERYRIPASITLAQGLLESGAGRSMLAVKANNHFGIKIGNTWNGPYVQKDDDSKAEKFRKYSSAVESFDDHSIFLHKPRYASLFELDITDYKGWAHGLKKCGYATNPVYAESLIKIIEDYQLYQYDSMKSSDFVEAPEPETPEQTPQAPEIKETLTTPQVKQSAPQDGDFFTVHPIRKRNDNYYIEVKQGDCLDEIAENAGVSRAKLLKYNELPSDYEVGAGDIIYFAKKKANAEERYEGHIHLVKPGESLYDISQLYAVRLSTLYRINKFSSDYVARTGDRIRIR